jgi:hypothetical protein
MFSTTQECMGFIMGMPSEDIWQADKNTGSALSSHLKILGMLNGLSRDEPSLPASCYGTMTLFQAIL